MQLDRLRFPLLSLLFTGTMLVIGGLAWGQNSVADMLEVPGFNLADPIQRAQAVATMEGKMILRAQAARAKAVQLGLPVRTVQNNGRVLEIADFIGNEPVYLTTHNANAAISTGANVLRAAPYSLSGTGITVGVWDGGGVRSGAR